MRRVVVIVLMAGIAATAVMLRSASGGSTRRDECSWHEGFGATGNGTDGWVESLAVFDDGTAPALYAGGLFSQVGGVPANNLGRWTGVSWLSLGDAATNGTSGWVEALAVYDDGTGPALYVGGWFEAAGGVTVNNIARWDGSTWSPLSGPGGIGVDPMNPLAQVGALAVYDDGTGPALYVGGQFSYAGGVEAGHIARWDGSAWSAVGGTGVMGGVVVALTVFDDGTGPALYVAGNFGWAGGIEASRIAKWDGSSWSPLAGPSGNGVNDVVYALEVWDDGSGAALYAAGRFDTAGGVTVNHVARWSGSAWKDLTGPTGTGVDPHAYALEVFDDGVAGPALYVGGSFSYAGGVAAEKVARWDGSSWSALANPQPQPMGILATSLQVFDDGGGPALHIGGNFTSLGGVESSSFAVWSCGGSRVFADGFEWGATASWSGSVP